MQKVYIETTIVSYLTSKPSSNPIVAGRQALTSEWWEQKRSSFGLVVSELVFQEAEGGDPGAAKKRIDLISGIDTLYISDEAIALAEALVLERAIPQEYGEDALHISLSAVNGIDFLMTWNCKHLAR